MSPVKIAALYKFVVLSQVEQWVNDITELCLEYKVKGTLLLAEEGINGTIAAVECDLDGFLLKLKSFQPFVDIHSKYSYATENPFLRLKVKAKPEIVTMGIAKVDPLVEVGTYVEPAQWNDLISDPEVLVIDTRNVYETKIGTFKGATDPRTDTFRDFPEWAKINLDGQRNKKIAMFCTGGIRCEKATSYLKQNGFENVFHLQGGILRYLEEVPQNESLWEGECFVFDRRVSVDHNLAQGIHDMCFACGFPVSPEDKLSADFTPGISCPNCVGTFNDKQLKSFGERQRQIRLSKERNERHLTQVFPRHSENKSVE